MIYYFKKEFSSIIKYTASINYQELSKLKDEIITKCSLIKPIVIPKTSTLPKEGPYIRSLSWYKVDNKEEYSYVTYNQYLPPKLVTHLENLLTTKEYYCQTKNYPLKDILNYESLEDIFSSPKDLIKNTYKDKITENKYLELLTLNNNQEPLSIYYQKVLSLIKLTPIDKISEEELLKLASFLDRYEVTETINNIINQEYSPKTKTRKNNPV